MLEKYHKIKPPVRTPSMIKIYRAVLVILYLQIIFQRRYQIFETFPIKLKNLFKSILLNILLLNSKYLHLKIQKAEI